MDEREQEYRLAAAECLEAANIVADQSARTKLLAMAQRWFDLANNPMRWRRAKSPDSAQEMPRQ
jgi:hypothetical protein